MTVIHSGATPAEHPPGRRFRILVGVGKPREKGVVRAPALEDWVCRAFEREGETIPFFHDDLCRDGEAVLLDLKGYPDIACGSLTEACRVALETLWQTDVRLVPRPPGRRFPR